MEAPSGERLRSKRQVWCLLQVKFLCVPCPSVLEWFVYDTMRYTSARIYQDVTSPSAWTRSTYHDLRLPVPCRPLGVPSRVRRLTLRVLLPSYCHSLFTRRTYADGRRPDFLSVRPSVVPPGNQPSVAMVTVFIARSAGAATCHQPIIALHSRQSCPPPRLCTLSSPGLSVSQPSAQPLCCEIL